MVRLDWKFILYVYFFRDIFVLLYIRHCVAILPSIFHSSANGIDLLPLKYSSTELS